MAPFCSCPASLVSRIFFAVGPGCAKCFFFCCAPLGAATFRRGQSKKKNTTQGVFFLSFFFCSGPVPAPNGASPSPAFPRGRSKKKNTLGGVFCFALAPCRLSTGLLLPLPFAGAAAKKKKHPGWCFILLWPRAGFPGLLLPLPFAGAAAKKKTSWGVFFFCCGPARTLTHSLRAWVAMPPPRRGGVFFFAAAPPGPGWCFFLLWPRPDAHSLTVGWGDFGKARVVFFFLLRPRRVFLGNSKKCLGYYIGSKKTRRGHSKKNNTTSRVLSNLINSTGA